MRALPLVLLAIAIPAMAAAPPVRDKKPDRDFLAGRVPGKPVHCIDPRSNQGPTVIDSKTILYNVTGRRIYRTGPVGTCPSLRPLTTLIVEIRSGQLCENDMFRVLQPGTSIPSGYCRFQPFVPYEKPAKPD
jgi:hypothetical protein